MHVKPDRNSLTPEHFRDEVSPLSSNIHQCTVAVSLFNVLSDDIHHMSIRDGPKFGRRRSSAEEFGRIFGSVRLGKM